jgi:two-component system NtrC family response regulator
VVDCASLPENLVESMLFGHEKGAFTGADKSKSGLIQAAHHGTLFLDEIGELPLATQRKFLRVLQEHRYRPVGGVQEQATDFRLVTATNRNLENMLKKGDFRRDLYYRLNTFTINLPPLRERSSDIKALAIYFANNICQKLGIPEKGFSQDFFQMLETYNWPGNVRELANTMELVLTQAYNDSILFAKHLPVEIRALSVKSRVTKQIKPEPKVSESQAAIDVLENEDDFPSFREYRDQKLETAEKEYLQVLVAKARGNHKKALKMANLARTRLYELLKKHGLSLKD